MRRPLLVILRPLGLGDFLTGIPAYNGIAAAFPHHYRILAAPGVFSELLPFCCTETRPAFDELIDTLPLEPLASALQQPDVAINLHGRGPASHRIVLATHPKQLLAFYNSAIPESCNGPTWEANEHEVVRWCRMLAHYGIPCDRNMLDLALPPAHAGHYVVLHPGAANESRRWPVERWTQLAQFFRSRDIPILLTGTEHEFRRCRLIAKGAHLPLTCITAGLTSLLDLAKIVQSARLVVSGDTGVAHLAVALRRPSVTLYGPISPALWGPPERSMHCVLWHPLHPNEHLCGDPHASDIDPRLMRISVSEVIEQVEQLLYTTAEAPTLQVTRAAVGHP